MSPPLVSVYMPTRNRLALLRNAVASVLAQDYGMLELIVVDDGSSDGSYDWLRQASAQDFRLRLIRNDTPGGAPRARNQAIRAARGEFVTGLDDDDAFAPGRIAALVHYWQMLEERGQRFSCLYTQDLMTGTGRSTVSHKLPCVEYHDLFFYNSIGNQVFTRRSRMLAAGLFDEDMPAWQDLDAFMRLLQLFGPALLLDLPLYQLDMTPRQDRISVGSKQRILSAYQRLVEKSAALPLSHRQALYLQVFGRLYGFRFGLDDLREYLRYGLHARSLRILGGVMLRQLRGGA